MGFLDSLFSALSSGGGKAPSQMSDRELQRKLNNGVGKNTGESISQRANYIREGEKRGITSDQKKK